MFNNLGGYSLADVAAATNREDGFGGNGAWWIIILFLFAFCGWGNNGFGGNGGGTTREEISYGFDMNGLENGVRGVQNGICDSTYALNNAIRDGFAQNVNVMTQGFAGLNSVINDVNNAQTISTMNNFNSLQAQIANHDCATQRAIDGVNYNMATDTCAINTNLSTSARDIIDSQNANTRAILEAIQQGKVDALQDKIAELTAKNQTLAFAASQAAQNNVLINELKPAPVPAYVVQNPYGCNCGTTCYNSLV